MRSQRGRSRGTNLAGGPSGQETQAFDRALHSVYDNARGKSNGESRYVRNPRDGRVVGITRLVFGTTVFERKVVERKHHLRLLGGAWALECNLISHLEALGVRLVCFTTDRGCALYTSLSHFRRYGRSINYGYGVQLVLSEEYFSEFKTRSALMTLLMM